MLYLILSPLAEQFHALNLFRYITFRAGGAFFTSLLISLLFGTQIIAWLKSMQGEGQPIRSDGPQGHLVRKKGTPTMGGFLILLALTASTLLWTDLGNPYVWIVLWMTVSFGLIGFLDDFRKLTRRSHHGVPGKVKLLLEILIALGACIAVAFTIVPSMMAVGCFAFIAYMVGNLTFATYLQLPHVAGVDELTVFCGAMVGAGLGFLWFNAPPASVFMGDTGSLSIGAALGTIAIVTKHELVLAIVGGLFVLEAVSVIVQVISYKLTGRRVFRMAPLHHHFEQKGWSEPTIVIRFWIIAAILAIAGLATLKLR